MFMQKCLNIGAWECIINFLHDWTKRLAELASVTFAQVYTGVYKLLLHGLLFEAVTFGASFHDEFMRYLR